MVEHTISGEDLDELIERIEPNTNGYGAWSEGYSDGRKYAANLIREAFADKPDESQVESDGDTDE